MNCVVSRFVVMIYLVFRNSLTNCTVFLIGINTNLPPCKTSVMAVDTEIVLNCPMDFATESLKLMVDVIMFLKVVDNPLTLSDNDVDCDIDLNEPYSLDTESVNDVDSVRLLNELYILVAPSDNDVDVAVILLKNASIDTAESDNEILSVTFRNEPYNLDKLSFNDILSVNPLTEPYILDTLSDNVMATADIVFLLISLLANESVILCD